MRPARGRRCGATGNVEFHHRAPFALGGRHSLENIELRCAAHNQYQAGTRAMATGSV